MPLSFAVAAGALWLVRSGARPGHPADPDAADAACHDRGAAATDADAVAARPSLVGALVAGAREVLGDPVMRSIVIVSTATNLAFTGPTVVGLPWLVLVHFGSDAFALGLVFAAFGAGSLVGVARRRLDCGTRVISGRSCSALVLAMGLGLAADRPRAEPAVVGVIALCVGAMNGYVNIVVIAWVQGRTDPAMLGRTMSFMMLGSVVAAPLSLALAAIVVDTYARPDVRRRRPARRRIGRSPPSPAGSSAGWSEPRQRRARSPGPRATMEAMTQPTSLPFTGDDEADRCLAEEPLALLIGFALDQQVTVQKAFSGPLELQRRLGHLDAARIAAMDPGELDAVFRERPALHRFPGSMADKIQALCAAIATDYGNDAGRVWRDARDGEDLERRLLGLPGIGEMKAKSLIAVLGKRFGVRPPGYDDGRADLADPRRRRLGRGPRHVPGRQARPQGGDAGRR